MNTVEVTEVQWRELEEWLEGEAGARLQCEVEGLEPRIVPWRGFNVRHEWVWRGVGPLTIRSTRLTLFGSVPGFPNLFIEPTPLPIPAFVPRHTRTLTLTQEVALVVGAQS